MLIYALTLAMGCGQTVPKDQQVLVDLARQAVESEVRHLEPPRPKVHSGAKAVFVTIERNGKVIGCRGDLTSRTASEEDEVVLAARAAAAHDPRYGPLKLTDLQGFLVTVTVVSKLDPMSSVDGLLPSDGLVLQAGNKKGIVLPWEGKDPQMRLKWAYKKAGVPENSAVTLFRLTASRCRG